MPASLVSGYTPPFPNPTLPRTPQELTSLLATATQPDGKLGAVFPLVYRELKAVAHRQLAQFPVVSLNTTGLVHEAYLKMAGQDSAIARDQAHFLAISAMAMRQILVAAARSRQRLKRGSGERPLPLDESRDPSSEVRLDDVLAVHHAVEKLEQIDRRLGSLVECRFFAGLTETETALALDLSVSTVQRDWRRAKAWLRRLLAAAE